MHTARKLLYLLGAGTRGRWLLVLVLALLVSVVEALGGGLVFVLIGMVTGAEGALELPLVGDVRRFLPDLESRRLFLLSAAGIGGFFLARGALILAQTYLQHRVAENAGARLADRVARGYFGLPYAAHLRRNSAELIRNAFDTVHELVNQVFLRGVRLVAETMVAVGLLLILLLTAPLATLLVVGVLLPLNLVMLRVVHPRLKRLGRVRQEQAKKSIKALQEGFHGMRDIKLMGREPYFADAFARSRARLARTRYLRDTLVKGPHVATETALVLVVVGVFVLTIAAGEQAVEALPVLGLFAYAGLRLKPSVTAIVSSLNAIRFADAAIEQVYADVRMAEHVQLPRRASPVERLPFEHEITLDGVTFRYEQAPDDALQDVSVTVPKGSSVGIVGPTGGGKTTMVDVMVGLLEPTDGAVRVDGRDVHDAVESWQANIGMVPQAIFLTDDTLRRNIALGTRDEEIDGDALDEAVRLAQLDEVVAGLPEGLGTMVGERGVRLSGGQRQRVAIARALYRRPTVLVFDEGTSALDTTTERQLIDALADLRGDRTIVTVAHRLSTVRDCDVVVLVMDGRVVDTGTYDDLVDRNPAFRDLAAEARG